MSHANTHRHNPQKECSLTARSHTTRHIHTSFRVIAYIHFLIKFVHVRCIRTQHKHIGYFVYREHTHVYCRTELNYTVNYRHSAQQAHVLVQIPRNALWVSINGNYKCFARWPVLPMEHTFFGCCLVPYDGFKYARSIR